MNSLRSIVPTRAGGPSSGGEVTANESEGLEPTDHIGESRQRCVVHDASLGDRKIGGGLLQRAGLAQSVLQQRGHHRVDEVCKARTLVMDDVSLAETSPEEIVGKDGVPHDTRRARACVGVQMYVLRMREPNDARAAAEAMAPGVLVLLTQLPPVEYLTWTVPLNWQTCDVVRVALLFEGSRYRLADGMTVTSP